MKNEKLTKIRGGYASTLIRNQVKSKIALPYVRMKKKEVKSNRKSLNQQAQLLLANLSFHRPLKGRKENLVHLKNLRSKISTLYRRSWMVSNTSQKKTWRFWLHLKKSSTVGNRQSLKRFSRPKKPLKHLDQLLSANVMETI